MGLQAVEIIHKKLVEKFVKVLDKADEIVAHNGDRFDIKWIRTRALYHGIEMRDAYTTIDTLKMCKKYLSLPSNKLAEIAKYFGLTLKLDPGGIETWINIIFKKDPKALAHMHKYCDGDVITLEEVYNKLRPYARNKFNYSVAKGGGKYACPECGSVHVGINKTYTTAAGTIQHFVDTFIDGKADAALAASVFHFGEIAISDLKSELKHNKIEVRL